MSSTTRWVGGIAICLVLVIVAAMVAVPSILALMFGGLMAGMGPAAVGALANEQIEGEGSTCIVDGAGAVTASQGEYVRSIVGVGKDLGVSKDGQVVAVMVALAESGLQNYANDGGNHFNFNIGTPQGTQFWLDAVKYSMKLPHDAVGKDADSVGLFQQRISAGWADTPGFKASGDTKGAVNRLMNPEFSARAFYGGPGGGANRGLRDVSGWESMEPAVAAQTVQGSAFPAAYTKWESKARALVEQHSSAPKISPGGGDSEEGSSEGSSDDASSEDAGSEVDEASSSSGKFVQPMKKGTYTITSGFGGRDSPGGVGSSDHKGLDFGADIGTPIYSPADGTVVASGAATGFGYWVVIDHSVGGKKWSTVYGHITSGSIKVSKGDKVKVGDPIAGVGNEGTSTGPHLHFEMWDGGRFSGGTAVDPQTVISGEYSGSPSGGGGCSAQDASTEEASASGDAAEVIAAGKTQIGVDYSWGGGTKDGPSEGFGRGAGVTGFDCSSLMQYALRKGAKYELPRTAGEQYEATKGKQVAKAGDGVDKLEPGDLLFYGPSTSSINHVAMYIGNGQMLEAPRTGLKVRTTEARTTGSYLGATRINFEEKTA